MEGVTHHSQICIKLGLKLSGIDVAVEQNQRSHYGNDLGCIFTQKFLLNY